MGVVLIITMFIAVGIILTTPFYLIAKLEKQLDTSFYKLHIVVNIAFITWSIYDLNYGYHYPHGINSSMLIIPLWPALLVFYVFIYPKITNRNNFVIISRVIAFSYFIGCIYGIYSETIK